MRTASSSAIGLGRLRSSPRPGLAALMEVAGVKADGINAGTVGFRLGPRINAAGRLEDASLALELLGSDDRRAALPLALRLNELNQERQAIEAAMVAEAERMVAEPLPPALVLSSPDWHEGVVGIVASRVAERFNRPAILLSEGKDEAKGSGRSIAGFDLLAAVEAGAEHLLAFGGHRAACGLRLRRDRIERFRAAFVGAAAAALTDDLLVRAQQVDAVVCGDDLTLQLADELELLAPHGIGNRKVGLLLHDAQIVAPRLTRDRKHLQYKVRCDGASCSAIHFNFNGLDEVSVPGRFDLPLALGKNAYNGAVSVQVQVTGLHRLEDGAPDLCGTSCALCCDRRLTGDTLWRQLLDGPQPGRLAGEAGPGGDGGEAATPGPSPPAAVCRTAAAAPSSRRSRRWPPPASACWCWSPTWRGAGRCSAATCCRRSSGGGGCTCRAPAPAAFRRPSPARTSSWPASTSPPRTRSCSRRSSTSRSWTRRSRSGCWRTSPPPRRRPGSMRSGAALK